MATKLIRTCDRLGCAIDTAPFSPGEELPSYATVGYTVLKTMTDEAGATTTETLADFDEVCASCGEQIEDLVLRIKGEKRPGRPRKKQEEDEEEAGAQAADSEEGSEGSIAVADSAEKPREDKPIKRRVRRTKAQIAADNAAAEAAKAAAANPAPEEDDDTEDEAAADIENFDMSDVLRDAVTSAVSKGVESLNTASSEPGMEDPTEELDTFETESGDIVNADTGQVVASPVEGEEVSEEESRPPPSNGAESAHPF